MLTSRGAPAERDSDSDAGFTLVEVIVALVLLGIVASAALGFFIEGTQTSSHLQRSQNAVAVANEAMELAYGVDPRNKPGTTVPGVVVGRAKTDVQAHFAAATAKAVEGVTNTYPLWDGAATDSTNAAVKPWFERELSGQTYEVTTLIGSCYRLKSTTATDQVCTKLPGHSSDPGETAAAAKPYVRMLRIIVVVTWTPTGGECSGGTCSYQLSGLVDRSDDLEWNQVVKPVAVDDSEVFAVNEGTKNLKLLANDLIGPLSAKPVEIVTPPAKGALTAPDAAGVTGYKPPTGESGIFTFTYRIRDARGAISDPATVTLRVEPKAAPDYAMPVIAGQPNPLAVLTNDLGSPKRIEITAGAKRGTAVASGLTLTYTPGPGVTSGTDTFTYKFIDESDQESASVEVTVAIDRIVTLPRTVDVRLNGSASPEIDLTSTLTDGNTDAAGLRVIVSGSKPAHGTLRIDGKDYGGAGPTTGASVKFQPPNRVGEYTFTYQLMRVGGATGPTSTTTIRVLPSGGNDDLGTLTHNKTHNVNLAKNDFPAAGVQGNPGNVEIVITQPPTSCGSFESATRYKAPKLGSKEEIRCSMTYVIKGTGGSSALVSAPVTVTWKVKG
ncbi:MULTISPECIES: Ig-like domain-containing protein [unclassified Actinotalea]|uniref:Ig-like domain-containing protein n=1 Tax=unclassified Actinotalea TaxID=2638618 RepID=UPI0015F41462|nr:MULTISPECIES: Ig-like domain-containing protein [unclassified Actinotalea]